MARFVRNSVLTAKVEAAYGVDASPTGAANAVLVSDLSINPLNANNIDRAQIRPYFGASEQLVGSAYVEIEFSVEFQHSGTAGTAAAWDGLLQACGFSAGSALTSPARVEHTLATNYSALNSATLYYYDDGALHKLLGARGTFSLDLTVGSRPLLKFKFTGLDGGITATTNATPTLTAWKAPLVITDTNTGAVVLGGTYAAGAISGGIEYVSGGLEIDLGNSVQFTDLLGTASASGQSVEITNREVSGRVTFDLTAANEASFMASVKANTTQSLGLVHGTTAGYKMLVHMPVVQLINPKKEDRDGRRMIGFDLRAMPSSGNDDIRIVGL
jgi:hypothetical protein